MYTLIMLRGLQCVDDAARRRRARAQLTSNIILHAAGALVLPVQPPNIRTIHTTQHIQCGAISVRSVPFGARTTTTPKSPGQYKPHLYVRVCTYIVLGRGAHSRTTTTTTTDQCIAAYNIHCARERRRRRRNVMRSPRARLCSI